MIKIDLINQVVQDYFKTNSDDFVRAKDLMSLFIKKGIFVKDHRNGLPIRNMLRSLEKSNKLSCIPNAFFIQKKINKNWYFKR